MLNKPVLTTIFLALGILCITCIVNKKRLENDITRIRVTTKIPEKIVDEKGQTIVIDFYVSYYRQYMIYELPYHKTFEINNRLIYDSIKYQFFICNTKKNGYLIKSPVDTFTRRIIGDSILLANAYGGSGWDTLDIFRELKISNITKLSGNDKKIIYKYTFQNEFYDSAYFYYNRDLKDIKFSFSKKLDAANNSKLNKVELFLKHDANNTPPQLKDFYVNSLEIAKAPGENEQELKNLFERFVKDEKLLSLE